MHPIVVRGFERGIDPIFVEIDHRKRKWLSGCSYNPHKSKIENYLNKLKIRLDLFLSKYHRFLLMGDFNSEPIEETMSDFMELYDLKIICP